jgi:hypothetical protein
VTVKTLDPRHDASGDSLLISYPFNGKAEFKVRVPATAMVQGEDFIRARIEGWFRYHEKPRSETIYEKISGEQFDPRLRQPEGRP